MTSSVLTVLALALATAPPSAGGETPLRGSVDLEGEHGLAIRPPEPPPPALPHAAERTVVVEPAKGGVRVTVRWRLEAAKPGWYADTLLGPGAHVERISIGGVRATGAGSDSGTLAIARVDGTSTIELVAFVPGDPSRSAVPLVLAPAVRGTLVLRGLTGVRAELPDGVPMPKRGAIHFGGQSSLQLGPAPAKASDDATTFAVGQVGVGVTVGDAEIRTHARLRWELRRGQLATVAFVAEGVGDDLTVEGPLVRTHKRDGERIVVELEAAEKRRIELELRWSKPTPKGEATIELPRLRLEGVTRSELAVEIARDGDIDVVPELSGWTATAPQAMPTWSRDLIDGGPTASFRARDAAAPGKLALLRFVPVAGPPAVIQRADVKVVATREGRALVQVRWELANERKPNLRVELPAGAQLLSLEAAGRDARPARDGDAWLVPVPRSLETVEGLVSVPVVVTFLLSRAPWQRRERRELELPTVDVPIGNVAVELRMPHAYASRMHDGEYGVTHSIRVQRPRRQLEVKYKRRSNAHRGPAGAASQAVANPSLAVDDTLERAAKDRILREATDAYQSNEFGKAQTKLDELRTRGLEDEDARRLQSNLDVVNAPDEDVDAATGDVEVTASSSRPAPVTISDKKKLGLVRRVREQAKARSGKKVSEQRERRDRAARLRSEGKYDEAAKEYKEALKVNRELEKLEQDESTVYDFESEEIEGELEEVQVEKQQSERMQKLVDPAWLSIGDGDHGYGAPHLAARFADAPAVPPVDSPTPPPPNDDGPRVLVPSTGGGDVVFYSFDLWAEGTRHALVVHARRRLELPPKADARKRRR